MGYRQLCGFDDSQCSYFMNVGFENGDGMQKIHGVKAKRKDGEIRGEWLKDVDKTSREEGKLSWSSRGPYRFTISIAEFQRLCPVVA